MNPLLPLLLCTVTSQASGVRWVEVRHDLGRPRPGCVVEVPLAGLPPAAGWRVRDARGRERVTQLLDGDGDGRTEALLFEADLPARGAARFRLESLAAAPVTEPGTPRCQGRQVPERLDDYAWENDRVAFRIYGPALAAKPGEVSGSGVDVWSKRVARPVIDGWYAAGDYHRDRGEGLDAYKVGESRGCGGTGVLREGRILAAGVWATQRTLAQGPLRVVFDVGYAPYAVGSAQVTEAKRITLERGTPFMRVATRVSLAGADTVEFVTGVVRRKGEEAPRQGPGWVATLEPEAAHGRIGTALVSPGSRVEVRADHALLVRTLRSGETFVHLAGACWDREGSFRDLEAWGAATAEEAARLAAPLRIRLLPRRP